MEINMYYKKISRKFNHFLSKSNHILTIRNTLFISVLTMLPTLFKFLFLEITSGSYEVSTFFLRGEFFLYSLSFLGSSYMIYEYYSSKKGNLFGFFQIIVLIEIILSSILFTAVDVSENLNKSFVINASIVLLISAIVFLYYSQLIDNLDKNQLDVQGQRKDEQSDIASQIS